MRWLRCPLVGGDLRGKIMSLTRRLLSAARDAYDVVGDGPVLGLDASNHVKVGYLAPPQGVVSGIVNQNAGLVGQIPEGVVLAIRGTTPPNLFHQIPQQVILDWAVNAVAQLIPGRKSFPGKVHAGFFEGFMSLWDQLHPLVDAAINDWTPSEPGQPLTIHVTGHSKGGALSALAAWRLRIDYKTTPIIVRTFASARIGNQKFAEQYAAAGINHLRYEYDEDIVPHLPLATQLAEAIGAPKLVALWLARADPGYVDIGGLRYIRAGGEIVREGSGLAKERSDALIARLMAQGGFSHVINCHGIRNANDGYVTALYQE